MGNVGRHISPSAFPFGKQKPQVVTTCQHAETTMDWADELEAEASRCINPAVAAAFRKVAARVRAESRKVVAQAS